MKCTYTLSRIAFQCLTASDSMFDDTEDDDAFFFPTTTTALHVAPGLPQQDTNCANASGPFAYHIDVAGTYWAPLAPSPLFPEPAPRYLFSTFTYLFVVLTFLR